MKELHLLFKKVKLDDCPILLKSDPDENWEKDWQVMAGEWKQENGYLFESGKHLQLTQDGEAYANKVSYEKSLILAKDAVKDVVIRKMKLFNSANKA